MSSKLPSSVSTPIFSKEEGTCPKSHSQEVAEPKPDLRQCCLNPCSQPFKRLGTNACLDWEGFLCPASTTAWALLGQGLGPKTVVGGLQESSQRCPCSARGCHTSPHPRSDSAEGEDSWGALHTQRAGRPSGHSRRDSTWLHPPRAPRVSSAGKRHPAASGPLTMRNYRERLHSTLAWAAQAPAGRNSRALPESHLARPVGPCSPLTQRLRNAA